MMDLLSTIIKVLLVALGILLLPMLLVIFGILFSISKYLILCVLILMMPVLIGVVIGWAMKH